MAFIETTSMEKGRPVSLYYEDYGEGKPVILIHGWPLSSAMWEQQRWAIVEAGYRCIAYDRRGFGLSDRPWDGYDYDTMSQDLKDFIDHLDLNDVTLVGFSMGGGELARYVGKFGTNKLSKLIFLSSIAPYMMKTDDNPNGVPEEDLDSIKEGLETDRVKFIEDFGTGFFNYEDNKDTVSEQLLHYNWGIASGASPKGTIDCVNAFGKTDLREDVKKIDIPTLFIHGDADNIVPITPSAKQGHELVKNSKLEIIENAPHGCFVTHKKEVNKLILDFLKD